MSAPIFIASAAESPRHVARCVRRALGDRRETVRWLFLGREYQHARRWTSALGDGFEPVSYAKELQALALSWRSAYVDWIGRMGERHAGLEWWTCAIAERNTMGPSLFHAVCYQQIGVRHMQAATGPTLLVVNSPAVIEALCDRPEARGRVRRIRSWRTPPAAASWLLRFGYNWTRYLAGAVLAQLDAKLTRIGTARGALGDGKPRVLLHSCIDESYFGPDGVAKDRYFPGLADILARQGYDLVTLPWLFNIKRSRRAAFRWFRAHGGRYLIPEDFYRFRDYVWAAGVVLRQSRLPAGVSTFEGLDVRAVLREARRRQAADPSRARFIRYYRLVEHLARRRVRVDLFIDMFENLASEKPSLMAFRRWMPRTITMGYQHYLCMYPLQLSFFIGPTEARLMPQPDVILAGSALGTEQLTAVGFPPARIRRGPTLKYQHLLSTRSRRRPPADAVLVALPMETAAAAEMVSKLLVAFGADPGFGIRFKLHPMMSLETFQACLDRRSLPACASVVTGSLDDCVARAACVVVMAGSSAFEVALAGVPVVVVGRDTDFDFNPLAWFPELPEPVHEPAEILARIRAELAASAAEQPRREAWAATMLSKAVEPLTDESALAFFAYPAVEPCQAGRA